MTATAEQTEARAAQVSPEPDLAGLKVGLFGSKNIAPLLCEHLRQCGIRAEMVGGRGAWPRHESIWWWRTMLREGRFDVVHGLGAYQWWRAWAAARTRGVGTVCEWIGSDVLELSSWPRRTPVLLGILRGCVNVHMANGRWLAAELVDYGVYTSIINAAIPVRGPEELVSLPAEPTVLAYLTPAIFDFYGGPVLMRLAGQMPRVRFLVVGSDGAGIDSPGNVEWLGFVQDMGPIYRQATVLVRPTRHDGLSKMVVEALLNGRYVVWSRWLPGVVRASGLEAVADVVEALAGQRQLNLVGMRGARQAYSPRKVIGRHLRAYKLAVG